MFAGDEVEPVLDILASNLVELTRQPVAEVDPQVLTVVPHGLVRAVGIRRHVVLKRLGQRRHAARLGAFVGGILAAGDPPGQVWTLRRASSGVIRPKRPMESHTDGQ